MAASTTAINALTALVSSSGSSAAALSGSAALSVVSTLLSLTANPAAVSPAAAPAALAGETTNLSLSQPFGSHALHSANICFALLLLLAHIKQRPRSV